MSTPTADDIAESIALTAADGVQSVITDGQTVVALPVADQIKAHQYVAAQEAGGGTNANGGPRSAWGMTRSARAVFGGTAPQ